MVDLGDVASTDHPTVRPCSNGKIEYAPPVAGVATSGFTLDGGRMDHVAEPPVAALVWRRQAHLVDFIWPNRSGGRAW